MNYLEDVSTVNKFLDPKNSLTYLFPHLSLSRHLNTKFPKCEALIVQFLEPFFSNPFEAFEKRTA